MCPTGETIHGSQLKIRKFGDVCYLMGRYDLDLLGLDRTEKIYNLNRLIGEVCSHEASLQVCSNFLQYF